MTDIYFHEDDYCQIEILPISNWEHCVSQIGEIESFSEAHRAPEGEGWSEMYMRKENLSTLLELNVSRTVLTTALCEALPECDTVYTGYSTYREKCDHTTAFACSPQVAVFADFNKDNITEHIWLTLDVSEQDELESIMNAFHALSMLGDLLFVDWGWGVLNTLAETEALKLYLMKRIEVFSELRSSFATAKPKWWQFWKK
jgi:hypothetical protein